MELFSRSRWTLISTRVVNCCDYDKHKKITQQIHGNIPNMFYYWDDPVAHLLLLKSFVFKRFSQFWWQWPILWYAWKLLGLVNYDQKVFKT